MSAHVTPCRVRSFRLLLVIALAALWCCGAAQAVPQAAGAAQAAAAPRTRPIAQPTTATGVLALAPYLDVLEDPTGQWTIDQVRTPELSARFKPLRVHGLGLNRSTWWFRFTAELPRSARRGEDWLLWLGWPLTGVEFYRPGGGPERWSGWGLNDEGRIVHRGGGRALLDRLTFFVPRVAAGPQVYYLRVTSETSMFFPWELRTVNSWQTMLYPRMMAMGLFYGIMLAVAVYNLFLYFSLRDRLYLWYVAHAVAISGYFLCYNWIVLEYLMAGRPLGAARLCVAMLGLMVATAAGFTNRFLNLARIAPRLEKLNRAAIAVSLLLVAASPWFPFHGLLSASSWFGLVATPLFLASGFAAWRRQYRPARYYLVGWGSTALAGLLWALTYAGWIPFTPWTLGALQATAALTAVLLSLGLADRIRLLQREHDALTKAHWNLEQSHALQALILDHSRLGIALTRDERLAWANRRLYEICGESPVGLPASLIPELSATPEDTQAWDREFLIGDPANGGRWCRAVGMAITPGRRGDGAVWLIDDVTERRQAELDRERLIAELHERMQQIKTLQGLLPICAHCKKIRNDKGFWQGVEHYIKDHSEAEFTHSICPDCAERLYPQYVRHFT